MGSPLLNQLLMQTWISNQQRKYPEDNNLLDSTHSGVQINRTGAVVKVW